MPKGPGERELLEALQGEVQRLMRARTYSPMEIMQYIGTRTNGAYMVPPSNGQAYTMQDVSNAMRGVNARAAQLESAPDMLGGVAMSALQGASFGWLDEALGLFSEGAKDEWRRQVGQFRADHPAAAIAAEAGGGLLVPGLASIKALRGGRTALQATRAGAVVGSVEGALVGAGEADEGSRLAGAGLGAGLGAALGAGVGAGAHGLGRAWTALTGRTGQSVMEEAREVAQDIAGQSPRGVEGILQDLERMQGLTPEARLADVPEMRPVARAAAVSSPEARAIAQEVLPARARAARERVEQKLLAGVGEETVPSTMERQARLRQRFEAGSNAYQELTRSVTDVSGESVKTSMLNDVVYDAWRSANRLARKTGEPLVEVVRREGDKLVLTGANPDFRTLQAVKLELDDMVSSIYRRGRPNQAGAMKEVAQEYYQTVLNEVSSYGDAQRAWMGMVEERRALERGTEFLRSKPREIVAELSEMAPESQRAYREAAIEAVSDKLRGQTRRGDVSRIFDSADMEERLQLLFPDETSFQRFLDELDVEREMAATTNRLLGGSETAESLNLTERIRRRMAGAEFLQRASIIPVAPGVGTARIAADVASAGMSEAAARRSREVGGVLGSSLLGHPTGLSARNLLTGEIGGAGAGFFTDLAMRSPRSLLLALQGRRR